MTKANAGLLLAGATALTLMAVSHRARQYYYPSSAASASPLNVKTIELAVKMNCSSCENQVHQALSRLPNVSDVHVDLPSQTVVLKGADLTERQILAELHKVGREARVIGVGGAGSPVVPAHVGSSEEWATAVAEFKGALFGHGQILGVLRLVQTTSTSQSVEAEVTGLEPNALSTFKIHKFGDTSQGCNTVGPVIQVLGSSRADHKGTARLDTLLDGSLPVWDVIGRSCVINQNQTDLAATVIARSANVGANSRKRLCTCSGTTIWEEEEEGKSKM